MAARIAPKRLAQASNGLLSSTRTSLQPPLWARTFAVTAHRDKSAIVTGSSRGIGKAIVQRLAKDGYDICVNDIQANQEGIDSVVNEVRQMGRKATGFAGDVSMLSDVKGLIEHSVNELGDLNTMVANAGIAQVKGLLDLTEQDFRRMFEVNVFGVQNCYAEAARQMIKQGNGGKILGAARYDFSFMPFGCRR
jgi:NAD(P)-dependent dehydrogenase (short-subunit alcohol dehydrogenase family)